jgi:hypothetical protein
MRGNISDLPKTVDVEEITIHEADWGDTRVSAITCHQSLDLVPLLKGLPNDMCQCPHWGVVLKGHKLVKYSDHEEELNAGDAYYMSPGHSTITHGGTERVEFSPKSELEKTNEAVGKNLRAMTT